MQQSKSSYRHGRSHIVHVARECSEIASAGGVGDVVLQLALECVRDGRRTTIVLPHYGSFSRERLQAIADRIATMLPWYKCEVRFPKAVALDVPMAYSDDPGRTEPAAVETIDFRGTVTLTLAFVVADRFVGKEKPYTYTAAEARAILYAPPDAKSVCGAELPPREFHVEEGTGHFDYFAMNVLLQKAALMWMERQAGARVAVHCHDAHTAMLPMMAKLAEPPSRCSEHRYVVTAHNCGVAYRQRCWDIDYVAAVTGVPRPAVKQCVIEGEFDPFGAAALYADHLTTVSDGYAWEVQGAWLESSGGDREVQEFSRFLAQHSIPITGIANGVAAELKGPEAIRPELGRRVRNVEDFAWKAGFRKRFIRTVSRKNLDSRWGIDPENRHGHLRRLPADGCLFTFVGRWTNQKGLDIIVRAAQEVLSARPEAGLCILGEGNQPFVFASLLRLVDEFPGRVAVLRGFSERLAAAVYAAGDFVLVPSRFEPCGLIDMIAQLNGNLPVVNQVGGLSKVIDGTTGIGYFATNDRENLRGLVRCMHRALAIFADAERHSRMQLDANREVRGKYAWKSVLARYAQLYGLGASSPKRNPKTASVEAGVIAQDA